MPILENLLGIDNQAELARVGGKTTEIRAKELVENHINDDFEVGTFKCLSQIHHYLFQNIYPFAGENQKC